MNKHIIARRRCAARALIRWADRIRSIKISVSPKYTIIRPEDAELAAKIQSIAETVRCEALAISTTND